MDAKTIIGLVAAVAAVAAAGIAYWGVRLQLDASRPLLTVAFGGSQGSHIAGVGQVVDFQLHIRNDGTIPAHGTSVQGYLDGAEAETHGPPEYNLAPDAQMTWTVRIKEAAGPNNPIEGHKLTARVTYSGRSRIVSYGTTTTLR